MRRFGLAFLVVLAVTLCLHTAIVKRPPPYQVVTHAAQNLLQKENPYAPQPNLDFFKYSPLAGLMMVPFLGLPDVVGVFLFLILQIGLFGWAFWRWVGITHWPEYRVRSVALVALFSTLLDVTLAIQNAQVNVGLFALMLLSAAYYAERKYALSGLVVSLATTLKLYPFTLGLCLLMGWERKYWLAFWGGLGLWLVLPSLFLGWEWNAFLLREWFQLLSWDQTRHLPMLDLGSFLALHLDWDASIRNPLAWFFGFLIGLATLFLFRNRYEHLRNRFLLPMNGLYVVTFSYLSESATSVLATAAMATIGFEALAAQKKAWLYWILWILSLVLIPIFYSDLVPHTWSEWARGFHFKTVGYLFVGAVNIFIVIKRFRVRA